MKFLNPYLTFNGNCREAMTFYQKCLGGKLFFQTVGESPSSKKMPGKMKKCILHSTLSNKNLILMGSDMVSENGLIKGNAISLMLVCRSEAEIKRCYEMLSENGVVTHPLELTYWGALFGGLTDKFGIHWMFNYSKQ
jgi:PhnB protein